MKELNYQEELFVLQYLMEHSDLFMDTGCARMVFKCADEIASKLGFYDCTNRYIIKVAMGRGGIEQLKAEVNLYLEYGDEGYLARIVAAGRFVEIMEEVDCWDFTDEADCGFDDYEYEDLKDMIFENNSSVLSETDASYIADTILFLQNHFGTTADNGQLGRTINGSWVAYDYGFQTGLGRDNQTSDLYDYIYESDVRKDYMSGLIGLLAHEEDFMSEWEKDLLKQLRDGVDEEESDEDDNYDSYPDTQDIERDLDSEDENYSDTQD